MEHTILQILKAVRFATCAHDGQYRKAPENNGSPYVTHCFDVMRQIAESGYPAEHQVYVAAALHDVVEDTDVRIQDIHAEFGKHVGRIVDQLTVPEAWSQNHRDKNVWQIESMRLATDDDVRIIKIADKVDNVTSLLRTPKLWGRKARIGYAENAQRVVKAATQHINHRTIDAQWAGMLFLSSRLDKLVEKVRAE